MAGPTRINGDQVTFYSSKTGTQVLDTYMEAAEYGSRTIAELLGDLFDSTGTLLDTGIKDWRGNWVTATVYYQGDVYRDPSTKDLYVVLQGHTSAASIAADVSASKVSLLVDISTAVSDAVAAAAASVSATATAAAEAVVDATFPADVDVDVGDYLRRNATDDGYEARTPAEVLGDIDAATSGHDHSGTYEPVLTAASQAEMEAGTEAATRKMSPLLVAQAISALATSKAPGPVSVQVFTASGTWTRPAGITKIVVEVVGGGGGGSGEGASTTGSGGAGGGYSRKIIDVSAIPSVSVTIGGGGAGGATAGGSTGGTSSFGAHCSATGGGGGARDSHVSNPPGSGSGGDDNKTGNYGYTMPSRTSGWPGGIPGGPMSSYGRGGDGAEPTGAAGGGGKIIVWEYE